MRALPASIWFAIAAGGAVAGERTEPWKEQEIAAKDAQRRGEFAAAETGFRSAIRLAKERHGREPVYEGASSNDLGQLYFIEGKFAMAENLFLRALERFREADDEARKGRVAANLSTLYLETGQTTKAENTIRPYLDLPAGAVQKLDWAILESNLGSIRAQQKRPQEAEDSLEPRLTIWNPSGIPRAAWCERQR